ncbi:isocitrate/isopropylmalate family dehydrogenase [Acuticoccus sediminis]|uniref:isocitrate/isopropylmalate family dehydrogenase n=1 Tax=Acuticoccus sediminis TaxID=2184697 RepID=UPI001CFE83F3|nr:isocitrate/isopropylmalate family dehydrogenase [Acuticoccus sediminis]
MRASFDIAVLPGDGVGAEITPPALAIAEAALQATGGPTLRTRTHPAGETLLHQTGTALPDTTWRACEAADAILLGPMGLQDPRCGHCRVGDVPELHGPAVAPRLDLCSTLDLYADLRPVRAIPGVPTPLGSADAARIDCAIVYAPVDDPSPSDNPGVGGGPAGEGRTRTCGERISRFALETALRRRKAGRKPTVTLMDAPGAGPLREALGEVANAYPAVATVPMDVDAGMPAFVGKPWLLDVVLTEAPFGGVLANLAAGLVGGLWFAPTACVGDVHAAFQPAHGAAAEIMDTGRANPTAAILSAAMMLDWLGHRHDLPASVEAAVLIGRAVDSAFADDGLRTCEHGGSAGVRDITGAVLDHLRHSTTPTVATPTAPPLL